MKIEKRRLIYSIITGLNFSLIFYFGTKMYISAFKFEDVNYSLLDGIFFLLTFAVLTFISYLILGLHFDFKENKNFKLKRWQIFVPLMLISTLVLLAVFPGHYPFDAESMYAQYSSGEYNTHFAPAISFLIGTFLSLGKNLFGSANVGHAPLVFLQFLFVNFALTETIFYCANKLKRKSFAVVSTVFFMIHPLVQILMIRSGQDTIFGGLFLLLCLELLKISEQENYFYKKSNFVKIFFITFLLCITRNNGLYVLLPVLLVGLFVLKIKSVRKGFLIAFILPILAFFGYKNLFINNIVVSKDSFYGETLNVLHMQIARSMYYNPDDESLEKLKEFYIDGCTDWQGKTWGWYRGASGISDPYKACFRVDKMEENPMKFIKLWAEIGSKNVSNYLEASGVFMLGLYHPYTVYEPYNSPHIWQPYVDGGFGSRNASELSDVNIIPFARSAYEKLISAQKWTKIPVLHLFWRGSFTTYLCVFGIIFALYKKKRKYLLPLSLILGLILTVALSPVVFFRYLFPAVITAPIMLYILIVSVSKK